VATGTEMWTATTNGWVVSSDIGAESGVSVESANL